MKLVLSLILVVCTAAHSWACCTPPQWEGIQSAEAGYRAGHFKKGLIREFSFVSYDATNKRAAKFLTYVNNGYENKFQIITRYGDDKYCDENCGAGKMYFVDLKKNKCFTKILKKEFRELCVPTKEKGKEFYLGLKGVFKCRGFEIKKEFRGGNVLADITVYELGKDNLCVPIGEQLAVRMRGVSFLENIGFVNLTPGIKNATVFDVPKICDKFVDVSVMEDFPERDHYIMAL